MQCIRCGMNLQDGTSICPNCGNQISYQNTGYQQTGNSQGYYYQPNNTGQLYQDQQPRPQQMNNAQGYNNAPEYSNNQQGYTGQLYQNQRPQQNNSQGYNNNNSQGYANNQQGNDQYGQYDNYDQYDQYDNYDQYDQYDNYDNYDQYDNYNNYYNGPQNKSPVAFIIFCFLMIILTTTEFLLFIKPGVLTEKRHDKQLKEAGIEPGGSQTTAATTEVTTIATTEMTTEATTVATTEATTMATTEAITTEAPTTEATTEASYNTSESPTRADFSWYMDGWHYNGIPSDAVPLTDYTKVEGGWKMMYWWDADHVFDEYAEEGGNAYISWDGSSLSLTYVFGYIQYSETEIYDESDIAPDTYTGSPSQYGFDLVSTAYGLSISGLEFYTWNGHQCAIGASISQSGSPGAVLLIRP